MIKRIAILLLLLLLTGCTGQPPVETTAAPTETILTEPTLTYPLRNGFYPREQAGSSSDLYSYLILNADGTGELSISASSWDIAWTENQILFYGEPLPVTTGEDTVTVTLAGKEHVFRYQEETMPEGYFFRVPPGLFVVSSVGVDGDVSFYGTLDKENGYLQVNEDGTGYLDCEYIQGEITIDEYGINWGDLSIPYIYYDAEESPDGEAMLMMVLTGDTYISIIFRLAPETAQ